MNERICTCCMGKGYIECRRCKGTRYLSGELCYNCSDGTEPCRACEGRGTFPIF